MSDAEVKDKYDSEYTPLIDPNNGREILLQVNDASIEFKVGKHIVKAGNHLNFNIYKGETFGLVGESGSGKTTISRAILRINELSTGNIMFHGMDIALHSRFNANIRDYKEEIIKINDDDTLSEEKKLEQVNALKAKIAAIKENKPKKLSKKQIMEVRKNIQMIFQDPAASLNDRANVDYIISEGLYNFHLYENKEDRINKVVNMLNQVGLLPEHLTRYPHEFSGGQRQRIGIARALVIEPELVLADEPISALDVSIRAQVLNLLKKLQNERQLTYLFIAHDLSIIRYISDRIAVMHDGYIVELGPAEEIYAHPLHPYTRSLLTAIPQPDPVSKSQRKSVPYNKGDLDYSKCTWEEFTPGHFVLVNDVLAKDVRKRITLLKKKLEKITKKDK